MRAAHFPSSCGGVGGGFLRRRIAAASGSEGSSKLGARPSCKQELTATLVSATIDPPIQTRNATSPLGRAETGAAAWHVNAAQSASIAVAGAEPSTSKYSHSSSGRPGAGCTQTLAAVRDQG
jgi:hypothetical protein